MSEHAPSMASAPPPPGEGAGVRALAWRVLGRHLFRLSPHTWYPHRNRVLRLFGARLGPRAKFRRSVLIDRPWNLTAGSLAIFGDGVAVRARQRVSVGARSVVSQYCILTTEVRDPDDPARARREAPITVGDDCWIAADTLVLPGAVVGAGTVVGARALVAGELPEWRVAVGQPAVARGPRHLYATDGEA